MLSLKPPETLGHYTDASPLPTHRGELSIPLFKTNLLVYFAHTHALLCHVIVSKSTEIAIGQDTVSLSSTHPITRQRNDIDFNHQTMLC